MKRLLFFISLLLTAANYCSAITETSYFTQVDSLCFDFHDDGTAALVGKSISVGPGGGSMRNLDITGDFEIPKTVDYEGKTYRVTGFDIAAVDYCKLNSLTIPETIVKISYSGGRSIYVNPSIKKMYLPSWEWFFYLKEGLNEGLYEQRYCYRSSYLIPHLFSFAKDIYINNEYVDKRNIVIPEGIERIPANAFCGIEYFNSIVIPKSVKAIGSKSTWDGYVTDSSLDYIVSYIEEPQNVYISSNEINNGTTIYVPIGTKEKYMQADVWNKAWNIIEFDPAQGMVDIPDYYAELFTSIEHRQAADAPATLYDLSGRRLTEHPRQGLYIHNGKKYLWPGRRR